jgi:hypothetical protein
VSGEGTTHWVGCWRQPGHSDCPRWPEGSLAEEVSRLIWATAPFNHDPVRALADRVFALETLREVVAEAHEDCAQERDYQRNPERSYPCPVCWAVRASRPTGKDQ